MTLMTPKMRPFLLRMVKYEPPALPDTGLAVEAAERRSCMVEMEPIFSDVPYTVKTNTKMMINSTVVCVLGYG